MNLLKLIMLFALTSLSFSADGDGTFINLGFPAKDIGVGSEGDVCVVGTDGEVYCYDFMDDDWVRFQTRNINGIQRLDVDGDGTIYIVSDCGIYYLDCENRWVQLPGTATDIGVGVDFTVWKIGTDKIEVNVDGDVTTNYGVWKLICDCECLCICRRRCIRFRLRDYNPCPDGTTPPKCYWFRTDGYGINIDVFPNGDAIIAVDLTTSATALAHTTLKQVDHHGMYFRDYECGGNKFINYYANDVTVGNTGVVYVSTKSDLLIKCDKNNAWQQINLIEVDTYDSNTCTDTLLPNRISAGPYNQVWFTHKASGTYTVGNNCEKLIYNMVYTSSRFLYVDSVPKNFVNFVAYKAAEKA